MVSFRFTVKNKSGMDARLAGMLVKEAAKCTSKVSIKKEEKTGDAKLIFHVLTLSIKENDEIEIMVEGEREQKEAAELEAFMKEYIGS